MKRNNIYIILLLIPGILGSCKKGEKDKAPDKQQEQTALLQLILWGNEGKETYSYNSDSSLKQTIASSPGTVAIVRDFVYSNGSLTKIIKSEFKKEEFSYDANRRVNSITETINSNDAYYGSKLEFNYNASGLVNEIKYFEFDDLLTTLKSTSSLEYNQENLLTKITTNSNQHPGLQTIRTLSNYSAECSFTPWALIEPYHLISEDFEIYNLPVLRQFHRLPMKVEKETINNGTTINKESKEFSYEINNKLLSKIIYKSNGFQISFIYSSDL